MTSQDGTSVVLLGASAAAGVVGTTSMVVLFPWAAQSAHSQLAVSSLSAGKLACARALRVSDAPHSSNHHPLQKNPALAWHWWFAPR